MYNLMCDLIKEIILLLTIFASSHNLIYNLNVMYNFKVF